MADRVIRASSIDELRVHNLGLIPEANIEPGGGLVVISGETGTGKTLLLGALRLLRGDQARKDQIGPNGDETVVEARLVDDVGEQILTRTVKRDRSRAMLDGAMATAGRLAAALEGVLDVVGQHDRTLLRDAAAVRRLLDGVLDADGVEALNRYREQWERLTEIENEATALGGNRRALERELDMVRFQHDEIERAGFEEGDDENLAQRAVRLRNAAELGERLGSAATATGEGGASELIDAAVREIHAAARTDASLDDLGELAVQVGELLSELNGEIARTIGELDHDPRELDRVEQRTALLSELKRKYGDTLSEILEFKTAAGLRTVELESLLSRSEEIEELLASARERVAVAAADLTRRRGEAGDRLAQAATIHLADLGFSDPIVEFTLTPQEPGPDGADRITLGFASDRALKPAPVASIASGGELSRLILALRLGAGVADVPIIAFDEIDAGIGGTTALAMGRKLKGLAEGRQVFCVTHLPQVAAFADKHYVVQREGNAAHVAAVDGEDRIEELSRMLAGVPDSAQGRGHAAELLEIAASSR